MVGVRHGVKSRIGSGKSMCGRSSANGEDGRALLKRENRRRVTVVREQKW